MRTQLHIQELSNTVNNIKRLFNRIIWHKLNKQVNNEVYTVTI